MKRDNQPQESDGDSGTVSSRMQAVKLTLADGRQGLFIGMVLMDQAEINIKDVSEIEVSSVFEFDSHMPFDDLLMMTKHGGTRQ